MNHRGLLPFIVVASIGCLAIALPCLATGDCPIQEFSDCHDEESGTFSTSCCEVSLIPSGGAPQVNEQLVVQSAALDAAQAPEVLEGGTPGWALTPVSHSRLRSRVRRCSWPTAASSSDHHSHLRVAGLGATAFGLRRGGGIALSG